MRREFERGIRDVGQEITHFLSPENPLIGHVNEMTAGVSSAAAEVIQQNDPAVRPSQRDQHGLVAVNIQFSHNKIYD